MQLDAAGARPPRAFLSSARARLGRRRLGAEGRSEGDLGAGADRSRRWPLSSPGYFRDLQSRLKSFVESGQLGPFKNGYWGSPAYKLPPEANLMAVAHYLEALDFQKEIVKIHTIFGGKNPHPNWLVGGVPCPINVDGIGGVGAINMERLNYVTAIIDQAHRVHRSGLHPRPAWPSPPSTRTGSTAAACRASRVLAYGDMPGARQRLLAARPAAAARRDHQRQSRRGASGRPARPGGDPGVRRPTPGTSIPTRPRGCTRGTASPSRISSSAPTPRAPRTNIESARRERPNIPGSRRRAGRAMRWRSGRSPAG